MTAELSLYGLYVPSLLLLSILALICTRVLGWLLIRVGFYRMVWHSALFEFALFFIFFGSFFTLITNRG